MTIFQTKTAKILPFWRISILAGFLLMIIKSIKNQKLII